MKNPFKPKTISHRDFEVLKDLQWHCAKCELEAGQAKTWQVWRQKGLQLATDEKGNYYKRINCIACKKTTIHRKLASLELTSTKMRTGISNKLAKRIKLIYDYQEGVLLRKLSPNELEVDHRFPQIRWSEDEETNLDSMSQTEIKGKFILLNRSNNLLKSRYCERCVATGKRGSFPGINFWYVGSLYWSNEIKSDDERGCEGCFWYDPYEWRKALNELINTCND